MRPCRFGNPENVGPAGRPRFCSLNFLASNFCIFPNLILTVFVTLLQIPLRRETHLPGSHVAGRDQHKGRAMMRALTAVSVAMFVACHALLWLGTRCHSVTAQMTGFFGCVLTMVVFLAAAGMPPSKY